ncbi:MAG: hypothetical protein RBS78_08145 [Coriobacteriia bacterium]|nr:hypothetical protein [Coriobacteriia bacterium]
MGDIGDVEVNEESTTETQSLDLPYFVPSSRPVKAPSYAKSALVGGILAGPVGAMVGAGYAADRSGRSSLELGTETFTFDTTTTDSEVTVRNRYLEGADLKFHFEERYDSLKLLCEEGYPGFLRMLQERIPRAQTLRTVQFAWVIKHGSLDGFSLESDEVIGAVTELDPDWGSEIAQVRERRAAETAVAAERAAQIEHKRASISTLRQEASSLSSECAQLGMAMFGAKADRKKSLKARIEQTAVEISRLEGEIAALGG